MKICFFYAIFMQNEYASTKIIKLFAIFTQVFLNWMFFTYNKYFIFKKMKHIFFLYLIMQFVIKFILHRYNIKIIRCCYRQSNLPTVVTRLCWSFSHYQSSIRRNLYSDLPRHVLKLFGSLLVS